jgi:hypothetical protein
VDPLGLCTIPGEGQLYSGPCATTGAEAIAAEQKIQAASQGGGFSFSAGLSALENTGNDVGHFVSQHASTISAVASVLSFVPGVDVIAAPIAIATGSLAAYQDVRSGNYVGAAFDIVGVAGAGGSLFASSIAEGLSSVADKAFSSSYLQDWIRDVSSDWALWGKLIGAGGFGISSLSFLTHPTAAGAATC